VNGRKPFALLRVPELKDLYLELYDLHGSDKFEQKIYYYLEILAGTVRGKKRLSDYVKSGSLYHRGNFCNFRILLAIFGCVKHNGSIQDGISIAGTGIAYGRLC
jgi:hypothetical protein